MKLNLKKLTDTEKAVLLAIVDNPGLTTQALVDKVVPGAGIKNMGALSAVTSRLTRKKQANRLKVPNSSAFTYYPPDASLPAGHTSWDNTIVFVRKHERKGNGATKAETVVPQQVPPFPGDTRPLPEKKVEVKPDDGVLIAIEVGNNGTMTFTVEQAKLVYGKLHTLFGK